MAVRLDAPVLAFAPSAGGSGRATDSVLVALAFPHRHEWIQDGGLIGLFECADSTCDAHAVCPGCLGRPEFALVAPAAGFVVYWCVLHCEPHRRKRRAAR
ncbi:MAG TPA: hypothetical protein VNG51_02075 [Ktedonobacteraceae bacterium]|nr:hypothetical protein [Ktedonobacteraceae bacterium]